MGAESQITIVMPVRNRAGVVMRTLESIAAQTWRSLSVVLVDNGSTDETVEVLRAWKATHETAGLEVTLLEEPMPGACRARNRGLTAVKTPYVMFFDSDDVMSPTHVERAVKCLKENPDADIVGWDVDCVMLDGSTRRLIFTRGNHLYSHLFHAGISTQRYVCRTELVRRVGGWNENLASWNDYELGVRLLMCDPRIVYAGKEVTVTIYRQTESITGTGFASSPERWERSLDACESVLRLNDECRAIKWIEIRRAILAGHYAAEGCCDQSNRLLGEVLSREKSWIKRMFYKFACRYTARGGRGVAILAKMIF